VYRYRDELPALPVPGLHETMSEYLNWVKPLLDYEAFTKTQELVGEFSKPEGIGMQLQRKLLNWQEEVQKEGANQSWLKPFWDEMYLNFRAPLVPNMNYYAIVENKAFKNKLRPSQIAALAIVKATMTYFEIVDQTMAPEMNRAIPMCMEQYPNTLKAARIPAKGQDEYYLGEATKADNHVILFYKNNMYEIKVSDEFGKIHSVEAISNAIEGILQSNLEDQGANVGAFTTAHRDKASEIYTQLCNHEGNRKNIETINNAILAVCMDESKDNYGELLRSFLLSDSKNRYFDKCGQIIVTMDGELGFNNEHTGADGTTWFTIIGEIYDFIAQNAESMSESVVGKTGDLEPYNSMSDSNAVTAESRALEWQLDEDLNSELNKMAEEHIALSNNVIVYPLDYIKFGKSYIKTLGISPDAFFHIGLQLAQYRTFGTLRSTYEPVAMRGYRQGRTECSRAVNGKVKMMAEHFDECCDKEILKTMIQDAATAHVNRLKLCQAGMGIERHLYGLNKMYQMYNEDLYISRDPQNATDSEQADIGLELFNDIAYKELKHDFISTSGLSNENIRRFGFGPVVEDGFGIGYGIKNNKIACTISCRRENEKQCETLMKNIEASFDDLSKILG